LHSDTTAGQGVSTSGSAGKTFLHTGSQQQPNALSSGGSNTHACCCLEDDLLSSRSSQIRLFYFALATNVQDKHVSRTNSRFHIINNPNFHTSIPALLLEYSQRKPACIRALCKNLLSLAKLFTIASCGHTLL
jgi:hypothetical protein